MIGHDNKSMNQPTGSFANFPQILQKQAPVFVILVDRFPLISISALSVS